VAQKQTRLGQGSGFAGHQVDLPGWDEFDYHAKSLAMDREVESLLLCQLK
jgi:hypothetical protein